MFRITREPTSTIESTCRPTAIKLLQYSACILKYASRRVDADIPVRLVLWLWGEGKERAVRGEKRKYCNHSFRQNPLAIQNLPVLAHFGVAVEIIKK